MILKLSFRLKLLLFGALVFLTTVVLVNVSKTQAAPWIVPSPELQTAPLRKGKKEYLKSTATMLFRDNLVDGVMYATAWPIEGFTNQFMAQINLIYLSMLSNRVPLLPSFIPSHMQGKPSPGLLAFSQVFDLPKLENSLQRPILEWRDVKNASSREVEEIGCWSVLATLFGHGPHFQSEEDLALDVSLTKVPASFKFTCPDSDALHLVSLASLGWPEVRTDALSHPDTSPSPGHKHTALPDPKLLCFDNLYYVASVKAWEWESAWSPSWNLVGQYASYNPAVERLARTYVARAFGVATRNPFPPYIAVHVRRTDFTGACGTPPVHPCFPPLSTYAAMVEEVKAEITAIHGILVDRVLVTSDEVNQTWWNEVHEMGWKRLDHLKERTVDVHGLWYVVLLDTVALSLAKGLVGTKGSTMSLVAAKRIQLWENGPVRSVAIGDF